MRDCLEGGKHGDCQNKKMWEKKKAENYYLFAGVWQTLWHIPSRLTYTPFITTSNISAGLDPN
jgi:hypothetical protein